MGFTLKMIDPDHIYLCLFTHHNDANCYEDKHDGTSDDYFKRGGVTGCHLDTTYFFCVSTHFHLSIKEKKTL